MRRAWWFTATARSRARFAVPSLAVLVRFIQPAFYSRPCFGLWHRFQSAGFQHCGFISGLVVVWNGISSAISSAPNLFEHNHAQVHSTNLNPIFYVLEEWGFLLQHFFSRLH